MTDEIRIDIGRYFERHERKPSGRGDWVFRLVSPLATAKDHELRMPEEMAFRRVRARVKGRRTAQGDENHRAPVAAAELVNPS
ncbi:hypothetical protein [Bradyrhizobium liaoningense]